MTSDPLGQSAADVIFIGSGMGGAPFAAALAPTVRRIVILERGPRLSRAFDRGTPSHQKGTARMGTDSTARVVDPFCRSHGLRTLFVVDALVLPTLAAVNPVLAIVAPAMRTAGHITWTRFAA